MCGGSGLCRTRRGEGKERTHSCPPAPWHQLLYSHTHDARWPLSAATMRVAATAAWVLTKRGGRSVTLIWSKLCDKPTGAKNTRVFLLFFMAWFPRKRILCHLWNGLSPDVPAAGPPAGGPVAPCLPGSAALPRPQPLCRWGGQRGPPGLHLPELPGPFLKLSGFLVFNRQSFGHLLTPPHFSTAGDVVALAVGGGSAGRRASARS